MQLINIPAGRSSELLLVVPAGACIEWRWGVENGNEVGFAVDTCAAPASAAIPAHALRVKSSLRGVHTLAAGYAGPIPHFKEALPQPEPHTAAGTTGASADSRSWSPAFARTRASEGKRAWISPHGAGDVLVRLSWDNTASWLHGRTLSRRVDVIFAGDDPASVPVEADPAAEVADARVEHMARFGCAGHPDPPGTLPGHFGPGHH